MGKYEYKVVNYDPQAFFGGSVKVNQIENQLNLPGNDGWEMVSCTSSNQSCGASKIIACMFNLKGRRSNKLQPDLQIHTSTNSDAPETRKIYFRLTEQGNS